MATVLEDKQSNRVTSTSESWNEALSIPRPTTDIKQPVSEYEVVFIVDENDTSQKAFDFALQTAKNFGAKLVLVYSSPRKEVPAGYLEFARTEGIRDYEWHYNNDEFASRLESLTRKAEENGVEWTAKMHLGNAKSAMRSFIGNARTIVVLNKSSRRSIFPKSIARLFSKEVVELGVPVMVL